jgi:hypothetical protein
MSGKLKKSIKVTIKNMFTAVENLEDNGDINRAWDTIIRKIIKISAKESIGHCESKHHKPWFDEECSESVD